MDGSPRPGRRPVLPTRAPTAPTADAAEILLVDGHVALGELSAA